jgi:hypothetical protein
LIRIHPDTFFKDKKSGRQFKMIKAEEIPITPEKFHFTTKTDGQYFSLFFEPLPFKDWIIDIIELDQTVAVVNENNFDF